MECPVCFEAWDLQQVRPKGLPCGHGVCAACVESLRERKCPTCRQVFADPVVDIYPLIAILESSSGLTGPQVWWCLTCKRPSSSQCVVAKHAVKQPKAALRRGLAGLATRCSQQLEGVEADCFQDMQDSNALAALELLDAERAAFKLAMTLDDGKVVSCDGDAGVSALAKMCLVAAAAKGRAQASGEAAAQQSAVQGEPTGPSQTAADVGAHEPDFSELSREEYSSKQAEKHQALLYCRRREVRRIPNIYCRDDPSWILKVLQLTGPTLEELQLVNPVMEHLAAVRDMPRLQRLRVNGSDVATGCVPAPLRPGSLKWLRLDMRGEDPLWSLLKGHAASLEVVVLDIEEWQRRCSPEKLATQLRQCGLRRLRRLVLWRPTVCHDDCILQLKAVRRALQGCIVQCDRCDDVPDDIW